MAELGTLVMLVDRILDVMTSQNLRKTALLLGLATDFEHMMMNFSAVRALLQDLSEQPNNQNDFQGLIQDLESVAFVVDEFLDDVLAVSNGSQRSGDRISNRWSSMAEKVGSFFSPSSNHFVVRHKIHSKLSKVTKVLNEATNRRGHWSSEVLNRATNRRGHLSFEVSFPGAWQRTHQFVIAEDIIGRDVEKRDILELVINETEEAADHLKVIPVVGIRGIGKTTLAKLVFHDEKLTTHFDLRIWVWVDDILDTRLIVQELIQYVTPTERLAGEDLQMDQLRRELVMAIGGKRFFLVLDNVQDESRENWLNLVNLFLSAGYAKGSTVLVTTRSAKVAKIMRKARLQYSLDRLSKEDSWSLFKRIAFERFGEPSPELEKAWRESAEKCNGVPRIIIQVASLYAMKGSGMLPGSPEAYDFQSEAKDDLRSKTVTRVTKQTHSFVPQEEVIGRGVEKDKIVETLLARDLAEDVAVVSIVGIPGVGKTALAQLVFNDERVQLHFDLKIWVHVTDVFDLRLVAMKIAASVTNENVQGFSLEKLFQLLRQGMFGKRYLLVLDDLWNEDRGKWMNFKDLLSSAAKGSGIIITTQNRQVAFIASPNVQTIEPLDQMSSWFLFIKMAFEDGQEPTNPDVAKIGKEIVQKCGGIPFVIRTIGSILYFKNPETEWQSFYEKELSNALANEGDILSSFKLSFDLLSPILKHCCLCCLLFPKDYEIDVQTLVNVWICQWYMVPSYPREFHEDLGYSWFRELLHRLFFKETERDERGNITKCKMQSYYYDLVRSMAAENVYATLHLNRELTLNWKFEYQHVSFDFHLDSAWQIPSSLPKVKRLRTFILNRQSGWDVEGGSGDAVCEVITKFRFLRMLDLHNSGITTVPSSIGKLRHLRYLDLSRNVNLKELPKSITGLWNLQTLKLNNCNNLQKLPRHLNKLRNLINLENESCYSLTHIPAGLGRLHNLRTLSEFVLSKGTDSASKRSGKLDELKELNDLNGMLKIKNLRRPGDDRTKDAMLKNKKNLLSLALMWDIDEAIDATDCENSLEDLQPPEDLQELSLSAYGGEGFSSWLPSHPNLVKLVLSKCNNCQSLPPLHRLLSLQVLVVDEFANLTYISKVEEVATGHVSTEFFPSLKELQLTNLPKLRQWWKDAGSGKNQSFCHLSKLTIADCPNLTYMPFFPTLEELLVLKNTRWEPLKQTIEWSRALPSTSSSSKTTLSKLTTLRVVNMSGCDLAMLQSLCSLRSLTLDHLPDIEVGFLKGLKEVTSLQELHIWRCDGLEELSGWIRDIKSLRILSLRLCPNLIIPSDQISLVTSLSRVEVENCPLASHVESMLRDRLYTRKLKPSATSDPRKINNGKQIM